jgi:hypothetical protein
MIKHRRDLYLYQEHALFIDGFLIQVRHLVNGRSIAVDHDAKRSETIEYFCVELDAYQVVFAEGAAAETFRWARGKRDAGGCAPMSLSCRPRRDGCLALLGSISFR